MAANTKKLITTNFILLLQGKKLDKITVTDLVEKCDISRQTFYYYFKDIEAVVSYIFDCGEAEIKLFMHNNFDDCPTAYADFFTKNDILLRQSLNTTMYVFMHKRLNAFLCNLVDEFLHCKYKQLNPNYVKLVDFWANTEQTYVINEALKDEPDYYAVFEKIWQLIPK